MKTIKVKLLDGAPNSRLKDHYSDNIFLYLLRQKYNVIIVDENPDILFYPLSHEGHLKYKNCIKIFFTEEPGFWDKSNYFEYYSTDGVDINGYSMSRFYHAMNDSDLVLSSYHIKNKSNIRFPYYLLYYYQMILDGRIPNFEYFFNNRIIDDEKLFDRNFCVFIHQNKNPNMYRIKFLEKLNKYKKVDVWNAPSSDMGESYDKTEYVKNNYKFCFGMENNNGVMDYYGPKIFYKDKGYTTEKIIEPFCANSIPLYWGNEEINKEFNNKMFVNRHDFNSDEEMIDKIIEIDSNKNEYMSYLNGIIFNKNTIDEIITNFLNKIEEKLNLYNI
jgi:hypothetical protein